LVDILNDTDLHMFSEESLQNSTLQRFVQQVTTFTLSYYVRVDYSAYMDFEASCFDFEIKQIYDYTDRNLLKKSLNLEQRNCNNFDAFSAKPMFGTNLIFIIVLATISLTLTIKYFLDISKMYKVIRTKYIERENELKSNAENFKLSLRKIKTKNEKYIARMSESIKKQ
jgi:hypothetical protein